MSSDQGDVRLRRTVADKQLAPHLVLLKSVHLIKNGFENVGSKFNILKGISNSTLMQVIKKINLPLGRSYQRERKGPDR